MGCYIYQTFYIISKYYLTFFSFCKFRPIKNTFKNFECNNFCQIKDIFNDYNITYSLFENGCWCCYEIILGIIKILNI